MSNHLKTLVEGSREEKREAIRALISDQHNRDASLQGLAEIIAEQSEIVHRDAPAGLKEGEPEQYAAINAAATVQQAAIQAVLGMLGPDGLLDDERFVALIDKKGMLERLGRWPLHVTRMRDEGIRAAKVFLARHPGRTIRKVKIFGLGGSGAPHDIAAEIIGNSRKSSTEIEVVHADEPNPDYVDHQTLAILASFSGNTEETIHCYETIKQKTPLLVALAKGGELREIAGPDRDDLPFMQIPEDKSDPAYVIEPRESVCLQMTATLALLASLGLQEGSEGSLTIEGLGFDEALPLVEAWRERFGPKVPYRKNPAKRLAFFLLYGIDYPGDGPLGAYDLWDKKAPFLLVDRNHRAIGHEARTQIHERSKLNAAFYEAPEFLHNLVESVRAGAESSLWGLDDDRWVYYFIRSPDEESRIRLRLDKTIQLVLEGKAKHAVLNAEGETPYQRALFATYFNAHMTTYLALLNGFDPLPVPTMSWIKNVMGGYPRDGEEERRARTLAREPLEIH
ncbi:MAG: SIS domain-containing protein [Planctomycetota bacterium]